jgi:hypothetical protein
LKRRWVDRSLELLKAGPCCLWHGWSIFLFIKTSFVSTWVSTQDAEHSTESGFHPHSICH